MFNDSARSYFLFLFSHFGLFWELLGEKMFFLYGKTLISLKAYESDYTGLLSDIKERLSTSIYPHLICDSLLQLQFCILQLIRK